VWRWGQRLELEKVDNNGEHADRGLKDREGWR
jgi:hypothetical protein